MKRRKRDMNDRAYHKGYQAGLVGRSMDTCPHNAEAIRQYWLSGWREGRSDNRDGYTGVSGVHREFQQ
ncbi:MAG: ribosome modulation factor [Halieaceae bacterium]|jgi:ribosome modulation factor|nr:ribosome modulation factor [Halieaceae bacterium]